MRNSSAGVLRPHDALERMAGDAVQERALFLGRAGHAGHPFGIGQLRGEIRGLCQAQIEPARGAWLDVGLGGALELVAGRADADCVTAGPELGAWKPVAAVRIAHHADRDRGAGLLRADQHAFHAAFFGGSDPARQRRVRRAGCSSRNQPSRNEAGDNNRYAMHGESSLSVAFPCRQLWYFRGEAPATNASAISFDSSRRRRPMTTAKTPHVPKHENLPPMASRFVDVASLPWRRRPIPAWRPRPCSWTRPRAC